MQLRLVFSYQHFWIASGSRLQGWNRTFKMGPVGFPETSVTTSLATSEKFTYLISRRKPEFMHRHVCENLFVLEKLSTYGLLELPCSGNFYSEALKRVHVNVKGDFSCTDD